MVPRKISVASVVDVLKLLETFWTTTLQGSDHILLVLDVLPRRDGRLERLDLRDGDITNKNFTIFINFYMKKLKYGQWYGEYYYFND